MAVAGAAMEIGARIGPHELGREAGTPGPRNAGRQIDLSRASDLVNCMQASRGNPAISKPVGYATSDTRTALVRAPFLSVRREKRSGFVFGQFFEQLAHSLLATFESLTPSAGSHVHATATPCNSLVR